MKGKNSIGVKSMKNIKKYLPSFRKKRVKTILYNLILCFSLFFTRVLDFTILSCMGEREKFLINTLFYDSKNAPDIDHTYIGFCFYQSANKKLLEISRERKENIIAVHYFDLICPSRYLVLNRGDKTSISIPWTWSGFVDNKEIELEKGITEINIYKFDYVSIKSESSTKNFFIPIVGSIYSYILGISNLKEQDSKKDNNTINFKIDTPYYYLDYSIVLKQIYFFYFYIPLILILVLLRKYNIHLAFLYFIFMPILFVAKYFMLYAPSLGLSELLSETSVLNIIFPFVISLLFGILFIMNLELGFKIRKEKGLELKEKMIVLYFLLLPIFLRI